jgi:dCTP deaminase
MSYWSTELLRSRGNQWVSPFNADQVVNSSYELTLGPEAYVTGRKAHAKVHLDSPTAQLIIPPGQFALLLTEEKVNIPLDAIGFISIKSRFKLHGLVNVSGFHVDPGFTGRLIFSVYNAGGTDVLVTRGERLFLLWISSLDQQTADPYAGTRNGQSTIPNSDVMAIGRQTNSPAAVNDRLVAVEVRIQTINKILLGFVVAAVVALGGFALSHIDWSSSNNTPTPAVSAPTSPAASFDPSP